MLTFDYKRKIYELLAKPEHFIQNQEGFSVINKVWDLRQMQSSDKRYKDAYGDFRQHIINNGDWEIDYIFTDRLNLLSGPDEKFILFIESFVDPDIRKDIRFIDNSAKSINAVLAGSGHRLTLVDYFENLPLYRLTNEIVAADLPPYMQKNDIIFYTKNTNYTYPCFRLFYSDWKDAEYKTSVLIFYFINPQERQVIGITKIMSERMELKVWDVLPTSFTDLPSDFCSLSDDEDFYFRLKQLFPGMYNSILHALRDASLFPPISERFENTPIFKNSLIKNYTSEKIWRYIRYKLAGIDIKNAFKFRYDFKPPYAERGIDIDFDFVYGDNVEIEHRIYALIGKNGTGKTRILSGIAEELAKEQTKNIGPSKPLYKKIFTLSYSIFDKFEIQLGNSAFNYIYCGLKKNKREHYTEQELKERLLKSSNDIAIRSLTDDWYQILSNFIHKDALDLMFSYDDEQHHFQPHNIAAAFERLSSGQHILLYVLTEMLAQIRSESLILYDEPETHLHPNAISELMNSILDLVKRFRSFCIIATHSPLVIQCLQSRNVYILNRESNDIELRLMEKESFGENLTVITEDIFGNKHVGKDHLLLLNELVERGYTYKEIIKMLEEQNGLPSNLNVRLQLKSLFRQ